MQVSLKVMTASKYQQKNCCNKKEDRNKDVLRFLLISLFARSRSELCYTNLTLSRLRKTSIVLLRVMPDDFDTSKGEIPSSDNHQN